MRRETKSKVLIEGAEALGWGLLRDPLDNDEAAFDRVEALQARFRERHDKGVVSFRVRLKDELFAYDEGGYGEQCATTWVWMDAPTRDVTLLDVSTWRAKGDAETEVLEKGSYFLNNVQGRRGDLPVRDAVCVARGDLDLRGRKVLGFIEVDPPRREARWAFRVGDVDVMVLFREIPYARAEESIAAAERAVAAMRVVGLDVHSV